MTTAAMRRTGLALFCVFLITATAFIPDLRRAGDARGPTTWLCGIWASWLVLSLCYFQWTGFDVDRSLPCAKPPIPTEPG